MKLSEEHKNALARMDALDLRSAAQILRDLYERHGGWPVANALSLCRFMEGEGDEARFRGKA